MIQFLRAISHNLFLSLNVGPTLAWPTLSSTSLDSPRVASPSNLALAVHHARGCHGTRADFIEQSTLAPRESPGPAFC